MGTYITENNGVIEITGITEGRYTIRETRTAAGYYLHETPKTIEFTSGKITEIGWESTPKMAQIQITKKSGDANEINGLLAGTVFAGSVFEAYDTKPATSLTASYRAMTARNIQSSVARMLHCERGSSS